MKHILDPKFRYKPSFATDIKKTFDKVRRQQKTPEPVSTPTANVTKLDDERSRRTRK